ncbi:MAG: FUSC family protein [Legionella sp.]|nr:FUSC family protein [Legionella sp.]
MRLRDTTKMAYKAAIAIAIAELISFIFHLERGYWITLTAMALTTQTWGDSLRRSLERVSMTILGGLCGTALYLVIPENPVLILSLLLFFIFFTVYLFQIYHLIAAFALTGFVVFLFATLGDWDLVMLRDRILDTALGAVIALVVGWFFLPVKTNIIEIFVGQIEKIQASLHLAFTSKNQISDQVACQRLYSDFQLLRNNALSINYEFFFQRINRRNFCLLMTESTFCIQYVVGLIEAYRWLGPYLSEKDKAHIMLAVQTTHHNLDTLKFRLKRESHAAMLQPANLTDLLTKSIHNEPLRFASLETEVLGFFNLMYFFVRLNTRLNNVYLLMGKMN